MNQKQFIYHVNVNANLIVENVTQIKSEIMIIVEVSVVYKSKKNIASVKKIVFGILLHAVVKVVGL